MCREVDGTDHRCMRDAATDICQEDEMKLAAVTTSSVNIPLPLGQYNQLK